MPNSRPERSPLWGALHHLTLSGPPQGDSTCGSLGGPDRSEPPGLQVTRPLSPDPRLYQEIRERGLNTSHESDDDLLDEPPSPEGTRKVDTPIVVRSYRPPQITWSQLPEVGAAVAGRGHGWACLEAPRLCSLFRGILLMPQSWPAPRGIFEGLLGERLEAAVICVCVTDIPQVRFNALCSRLMLTCRELWAWGTPSQGADPEMCLEGPSEEAGREGRGQTEATCHYQAHHHLPHLKTRLVPSKQGSGVSVESVAETEAPELSAERQLSLPRKVQLAPGTQAAAPSPGSQGTATGQAVGVVGSEVRAPGCPFCLWYDKAPHPHLRGTRGVEAPRPPTELHNTACRGVTSQGGPRRGRGEGRQPKRAGNAHVFPPA